MRKKEGTARPLLGATAALLGFAALIPGFLLIAFPTQSRSLVGGLWITEALAIALPAAIAVRSAGARLGPYLGLRAPSARMLGFAALAAIANQPIVSLLTFASHAIAPASWVAQFDETQRMLERVFAGQTWAMISTVSVAAPLGEEIFFRGFAQPALQRSWGATAAVLVSGALFALMHQSGVGFIGLWEIGVALGLLRHASGSLWPSILFHAVNNAAAAFAFVMGWEDPSVPPPAWFLALGGPLLVGGVVAAARIFAKPSLASSEEAERPADRPPRLLPSRALGFWAIWIVALALGAAQIWRLLPPPPFAVWVELAAAAVAWFAVDQIRAARTRETRD